MEKFRAVLAKSHDPAPRADSLMREWLAAYVTTYRADSAEETVVYDDTKRPVRSSDAFRALLAEPMPAGIDAEPFGYMLSVPRSARPAAITDAHLVGAHAPAGTQTRSRGSRTLHVLGAHAAR